MKGFQLGLVCLLATAHASGSNSDVRTQSVRTAALSSQSVPMPSQLRHRQIEQANLADFGGGMVDEMRATSEFVQQSAVKAGTRDSWLIALAAFGLVFLQVRRKHKSLPQRRIAPYA
jgi:hypothetical protein